ncbi:MAG: DUF2341 domain-containing protein [Bryobacteraceae bacterium]|nr:DUF2341 domain-containing protein [Bryobacteraceae bacterium]
MAPLLASLTPAGLLGGQLFSDDFNAGLKSHWTVVDEGTIVAPSKWSVSGGVLQQTTNIYGNSSDPLARPGTYLLTGSALWTNYSVSVRMRTAVDDDVMGLMFGYRDAGNYYRFSWDRERSKRQLVKFVNGAVTLLAEDGVPYKDGQWYAVEAKMIGGKVEIWIDGSRIFQVSDVSHNSGKIALYSWWNLGVKFDDVVVTSDDIAGSEPACSYSISPTQASVGAAATAKSVAVTAPSGCAWTASSGAAWLQITSGASGSGNGTVNYSVQANGSVSSRTGALTIAGITFTVTQSGSGSAVSQSVLFSDDFSAGLKSHWTVVDEGTNVAPSSWSVSGGVLAQKTNIYGNASDPLAQPGTYLLTGSDAWVDYNVSVRMMTAVDDDVMGLMFAYRDAANYYRFSWDRERSNRRLVKFVDGKTTLLATDNTPFQDSRWYTVEARLAAGTVEIWIDGTRIFQVSDSSHSSGKIALYSWWNLGVKFDDVQVSGASGGGACSYSISPTQANTGSASGVGSVGVTAQAGCSWTASSNAAWISITSGGSGSGDGTVEYAVTASSGSSSRSGTLTIAGKTFTLTQAGDASCSYAISPTQASAASGASTGSVAVTSASGCAWTASSNAAWLSITSGASGSGNGGVGYSVQANGTASSRQGTLTIAGQTFTVTQQAAACSYSISPAQANAAAGGASGSVAVTAGSGCAWTASSNAGWISITSGASGSGNGGVGYSAQANGTTSSRQGTLTIAGQTFTLSQAAGVSGGASSGAWYNGGWAYRKAIVIQGGKVSGGPHANFPVLVQLYGDANLAASARNDGSDILFTLNDHATKLDHEIELFDRASGKLTAWVRVPSLSGAANTTLYMYYGNSGAANQQNPSGVWDANYVGVWHLGNGDSTAASFYKDSSGGNHGTMTDAKGNATNTPAAAADGMAFAGDSDGRIRMATAAALNNLAANGMTVEIWAQADSRNRGYSWPRLVDKNNETSGGWKLYRNGSGAFLFSSRWSDLDQWWQAGTLDKTTPAYMAVAYDGSSGTNDPAMYKDGQRLTITSRSARPSGTLNADASVPLAFANQANGNRAFDGLLDEVRISKTIRSDGWIQTTYNAIKSPETFLSAGSEQSGTGGSGEDSGSSDCSYTLNPTQATVGAGAGSGNTVGVTSASSCAWTASSNAGWISVTSGSSGSGNGSVGYSVQANPATSSRQGTLTIAGQTFTVTQQAAACSYSISPTQINAGSGAASGSVAVTASSGCAWTASSNAGWISITSGESGSGNGSVGYSVQANATTSSRQGTLTIGGQTFTVTQQGDSSSCAYGISPGQVNVAADATTGSVAVTAASGCAWTASSNAAWISITSGSSGSGNGNTGYSVQANGTSSSRQGTLTIAGQTFTVTQEAGTCGYALSPTVATVGPSSTTGKVNVTTATGCPWTASSSAAWLSITSGASGNGSGSVNYSVQSNSGAQRQATLTIGGQTFTLSQLSSSGCQFTLTPTLMNVGPDAGTSSVNITTTSGCSWTVTSLSSWIGVNTPKAGTGSGKSNFSFSANTTGSPRTGGLSIGGVTVQVNQLAAIQGNVFHVPPGANLQQAIDQAKPGDTITLEPGVDYRGSFYLRKKTGNQFITITTSAPHLLPPPGTRVTPADAPNLPKVSSPSNSPVFRTDTGAHHYRLVGLQIRSPGWYNWDLIRLGSDTVSDVTQQSSDFELDRLYIHGDPSLGAKRGITLNTASTIIKNCYISDIKGVGQETQAILGWNGPGPYDIINNHLEAAGENIMFGGATARIPNLVPSDIVIKNNYITKKLSWWANHPTYEGKLWTVKNILELKNARRVLLEGNIFEHNWRQAQAGYAIVLTVRTQGGAMPWAVVEDVTFVRNIIRRSGAGVNILGKDYNGSLQGITRRITFRDNVFDDIDNKNWPGEGRMVQLLTAPEDITFEHNTFNSGALHSAIMFDGQPTVRFVFRNNLMFHGTNGVFGSGKAIGTGTLNYYAPGYVFTKNALWGAASKAGAYPSGNYFPASIGDVKFVNVAAGDFRLSSASPYRNLGTDGADLGANVVSVESATVKSLNP